MILVALLWRFARGLYQGLIEGDEPVTLRYMSDKGGTIEQVVPLQETEPAPTPPAPGEDT